jgi:hypothetical protein
MKTDPIVEEVREARRKLAEKFQFDVKKIFADAKSREATSGHTLIRCKAGCVCEEPAEYKTKNPENGRP